MILKLESPGVKHGRVLSEEQGLHIDKLDIVPK